jgi:purine/pyrimidine-nucleoside phosphorylase
METVMSTIPAEFSGVTAITKANIYYDGKVISHAIAFPDGSRKTLGVMFPGTYTFGTGQPERMEIVEGEVRVKLQGEETSTSYGRGGVFEVPGNSSFEIEVAGGICEYICSFLS